MSQFLILDSCSEAMWLLVRCDVLKTKRKYCNEMLMRTYFGNAFEMKRSGIDMRAVKINYIFGGRNGKMMKTENVGIYESELEHKRLILEQTPKMNNLSTNFTRRIIAKTLIQIKHEEFQFLLLTTSMWYIRNVIMIVLAYETHVVVMIHSDEKVFSDYTRTNGDDIGQMLICYWSYVNNATGWMTERDRMHW